MQRAGTDGVLSIDEVLFSYCEEGNKVTWTKAVQVKFIFNFFSHG
jgi:hypothetical protein